MNGTHKCFAEVCSHFVQQSKGIDISVHKHNIMGPPPPQGVKLTTHL
jgi:hypothetical protein